VAGKEGAGKGKGCGKAGAGGGEGAGAGAGGLKQATLTPYFKGLGSKSISEVGGLTCSQEGKQGSQEQQQQQKKKNKCQQEQQPKQQEGGADAGVASSSSHPKAAEMAAAAAAAAAAAGEAAGVRDAAEEQAGPRSKLYFACTSVGATMQDKLKVREKGAGGKRGKG
jgi:hypothetical protein